MKAFFSKNLVVILAASVALGACGSDMDDLDQYINEIKARPGGRIEPLPEITPYEVFTYTADAQGLRSPFVPDSPQVTGGPGDGGTRPDPERSREFLESFPLDTLRMVGTLELAGTNYGLVQTSDGLIHRVVPGNYMGQNDGRIVAINESDIELIEIVSDGIGGYLERRAAVMHAVGNAGESELVGDPDLLHQFPEALLHVVFLGELGSHHQTELHISHRLLLLRRGCRGRSERRLSAG